MRPWAIHHEPRLLKHRRPTVLGKFSRSFWVTLRQVRSMKKAFANFAVKWYDTLLNKVWTDVRPTIIGMKWARTTSVAVPVRLLR